MSKYVLSPASGFVKDLKKLKDKITRTKAEAVILQLLDNPFDNTLRTHQINIPGYGKVWSSRITGDLRLIWVFDKNDNLIIIALRLQGHDTVYS